MNKGFFVVFLGVVIGAMALIFFNQASSPVDVPVAVFDPVRDADKPASAPSATPGPVATAPEKPRPQDRPAAPQPDPAPVTAKPATPANGQREPAPVVTAPTPPVSPPPAVTPPRQPETPGQAETPMPVTPKPNGASPETPKVDPPKIDPPVAADPPRTEPAPKPQETAPVVTAKPDPRKTLTLVNIGLRFKDNGMALRLEADGPFSYKTFVLAKPDRYVVDLLGKWRNVRAPSVPSNMLIKAARSSHEPGRSPRLVLDLQRPPRKHDVVQVSPTVLEIYVE